jgi:hypothetical protein
MKHSAEARHNSPSEWARDKEIVCAEDELGR